MMKSQPFTQVPHTRVGSRLVAALRAILAGNDPYRPAQHLVPPQAADTRERCASLPPAETRVVRHSLWSAGLEYTPQRLDHNG